MNRYFASFCERNGNTIRVGDDGVRAFKYVLSLGPEEFRPKEWRPANPSHLLPVLLLIGGKLGLGDTWYLKAIDRVSGAYFMPRDYRNFADEVIEHGTSYTHQIGFGIWNLADYMKEFGRALSVSETKEVQSLPREGAALSMMASLLFSDRLPLILERV